jgi:hypothetical protein
MTNDKSGTLFFNVFFKPNTEFRCICNLVQSQSLLLKVLYNENYSNMGQKWFQSKAYYLGLGRLGLILHFKGPWHLKFK